MDNSKKSAATCLQSERRQEGLGYYGITYRSIILGVIMIVAINLGAPYSSWVLHSTYLATNYFPLGVAFPFFIIVTVVNVALKAVDRRWALTPAELIVVFIMGIVTSTIPTYGMTGYLIAIIAAPYYFATSENRWAEFFHEYIPDWICPQNVKAMDWFFNGAPRGEEIPWSAWITPLCWWLLLIGAVLFLCLSIIVILRKQWIEKERLSFPLAEIPLDMVEESDSPILMPKFMRTRIFWIGFSLAVFFLTWNMVSYFYPLFPTIPRRFGYIRIKGFPTIATNVYPPMTGIAFLLHLDVSFSVWFFYLLGVIQVGIFNRVGYTIGTSDVYCSRPAAMGWQGWGGFIVMVIFGIYMARNHIKDVILKAFNKDYPVDDSNEILSYRTAVFGSIISLIFIAFWMRRSGMSYPVIFLFIPAALIAYIGLTRIVSEGGLVFLRPPLIPQSFAVHVLGSESISPACMTAIGFSYAWYCDIIATFMPCGAISAKAGFNAKLGKRAILIAIVLAIVLGIIISIPFTLYMGYKHGAYNFGEWQFRGGAATPFNNIVTKLSNPANTDWNRLMFLGIGAAVMSLLTFMRYRFQWWPLHPFGFPLAAVGQVQWSCFSVFVGWLAKFIVMKLGGIGLYQKVKPFFIGMIMGYFFGSGVSWFVDWIWFFGEGHNLYL